MMFFFGTRFGNYHTEEVLQSSVKHTISKERCMQWIIKLNDILDEPADVLICSANPRFKDGPIGEASKHKTWASDIR